jgi:3-deoxy-D-manno-octulosonic-acid transferase
MYFLYSFALSILFLLLLPYFIFQAIAHGKYFRSFRERIGKLPDAINDQAKPTLWVHTVSVGEFNAARPLLERLKKRFPQFRLVVSTTTMTGQALARKEFPEKLDAVFYFPFDWKFAVRRALDAVNPAAVIILETELWPNFLRQCKRRDIKTVIVNGRISPRSFARYSRIRGFISRVLNDASLLIMQSEDDAWRVRALGADDLHVRVCGNLKYDVVMRGQESEDRNHKVETQNPKAEMHNSKSTTLRQDLDTQLNLSAAEHLIVAGSTAPEEEAILLKSLRDIRHQKGLENVRLLIAPRHPERFDEVADLIAASKFTVARRSKKDVAGSTDGLLQPEPHKDAPQNPASPTPDVILLDTIGELASVYEFASVVFVGGSLVAKGGHNILEPAAFAKPIIVGPHTENFRQIIADFAQANAVVQIQAKSEDAGKLFTREMIRLLTDSEAAQAMGERAASLLLKNRGATDCALAEIEKLLSEAKGK